MNQCTNPLARNLQSFFAGLAASGALTSGLRLITKAVFDKTDHGLRKGVILFLAISVLIQFLCIFFYAYVFGKLPIVKYYRKNAAAAGSKTVSADLAAAGIQITDNEKVKQFITIMIIQIKPNPYSNMKINIFSYHCRLMV